MKNLVLTLTILILAGCAFDKDGSTTSKTELRENQKQSEIYNSIKGNYRGQLTTATTKQDVELNLDILERIVNSKKELILIGNYKKNNPVGPNLSFNARYTPENGQLVLMSNLATFGPDDIHTISLQVQGTDLIGEAKSISGVVGRLHLSLVSRQSDTPNDNAGEDYKERLRAQYNAIAGSYKGNVIPPPQDGAPFAIIVRINVADVADANGEVMPQLMGILSYPAYNSTDLDMTLTMTYRPDLNPPQLSITARPRFSAGSDYRANLQGTLKNGKYTGSMTSTAKGFEGNFTLTKQP
jgi:hypothetical protein